MSAVIAMSRRPAPPPKRPAERRRSEGRARAAFVPGRAKPALSIAPPASPSPEAQAATKRPPALTLGLSPGPERGAAKPANKWTAVKTAVDTGNAFAQLSVPYKMRRDEQRLQRKHGTNIGPKAHSPRWDVQDVYRQLFFPHRQTEDIEDDPFGGEEEASNHWSSIVANDNYAMRKARDRLHAVDVLKRRFKSASVKLAQDGLEWAYLFAEYDADGDGTIGLDEFKECVRNEARISEEQINDKEIAQLFKHVDEDGSGEITVDEFTAFMSKSSRKRPKLPPSGALKVPGRQTRHLTPMEQIAMATREAERMEGVPFIAEYIALERLPLREKSNVGSKVVGYLEKNEVVAVTQVWAANEMKCHRLKWGAKPTNGWCSHRGKNKGGRTNVLLSRLTRDEWSAIAFHETSVAHRISTLANMYKIQDQPEVKHERRLRAQMMGPENQLNKHKADQWVCTELGLEDPEQVGVGFLSRCTTDDELEELVNLLERTPRQEWRRVATEWESTVAEHRSAQQQLRQTQEGRFIAPMPPVAARVFACIDRALVIRQIAEARRQAMEGGEAEEEEATEEAAEEGPRAVALSQLEQAVLQAHAERRDAVDKKEQERTARAAQAASSAAGSAAATQPAPPASSAAGSAAATQPAPPLSVTIISAEFVDQSPTVPLATTVAASQLPAQPLSSPEKPTSEQSVAPEGPAPSLKLHAEAEANVAGARDGSCTNALWRTPQAPPLARSARCRDPPPRAHSTRRQHSRSSES